MRSRTEASLALWPMRILRPWQVATVTGLLIGASLLYISSPAESSLTYPEYSPRAASSDHGVSAELRTNPAHVIDPFAPAPATESVIVTGADLSSSSGQPGSTP